MPDVVSDNSDSKPIGIDPNDRITPSLPISPVSESLTRIADYSERQREKNPPTIVDFNNFPKTTIAFHNRLRVIEFIFCASVAADHVSMAFGGRVFDFILALGTNIVPFAYEADLGVDITFTNVTSPDHLTYAYIIAYTE